MFTRHALTAADEQAETSQPQRTLREQHSCTRNSTVSLICSRPSCPPADESISDSEFEEPELTMQHQGRNGSIGMSVLSDR